MESTTHLLIAANCTYVLVLLSSIYLTRATMRRVAGALSGGIVVAIVGVGIEATAHKFGWWRYPGVDSPYGPPLIYPCAMLMLATVALIGWRVTRRLGCRGQLVFLGCLAVIGTARDYIWATQRPDLIVFNPGIGIVLVDAACWLILAVLAQLVMLWVAGPARSNRLARAVSRS